MFKIKYKDSESPFLFGIGCLCFFAIVYFLFAPDNSNASKEQSEVVEATEDVEVVEDDELFELPPTSCEVQKVIPTIVSEENSPWAEIDADKNLYYNRNTKVVYYIAQYEYVDGDSGSYVYMTEYIAENGKPYRYVNDKMQLIQDD